MMFRNGAEYGGLYPEDDRPRWRFCAPRLDWGDDALHPIRASLLDRAAALGYAFEDDPELHLIVDGETVQPLSEVDGVYRFQVPAGGETVWLASRSAVPAEIEPNSGDRRRLGVAVERILLHDAELSVEAWHGHAALAEGFHDDEGTHRWTDGLARLPADWRRLFARDCIIEIRLLSSGLRYPLAAPDLALAAA